MKLDREKFLAAAMILSATSGLGGCQKSEDASADSAAGVKAGVTTKGTTVQSPLGVKQVSAPAREGMAPAREGVAPAREGVAPAREGVAPAAEGKPTATPVGVRPPGVIKLPGKLGSPAAVAA